MKTPPPNWALVESYLDEGIRLIEEVTSEVGHIMTTESSWWGRLSSAELELHTAREMLIEAGLLPGRN